MLHKTNRDAKDDLVQTLLKKLVRETFCGPPIAPTPLVLARIGSIQLESGTGHRPEEKLLLERLAKTLEYRGYSGALRHQHETGKPDALLVCDDGDVIGFELTCAIDQKFAAGTRKLLNHKRVSQVWTPSDTDELIVAAVGKKLRKRYEAHNSPNLWLVVHNLNAALGSYFETSHADEPRLRGLVNDLITEAGPFSIPFSKVAMLYDDREGWRLALLWTALVPE